MKYIDADKLIANLERQNVDKKVIEPVIRIIDSLQQEQLETEIKSPFTGGKVVILSRQEEVTFRGEKVKILRKYYRCEDTGREFTDSKLDDDMMWTAFRAYCEKKEMTSFTDIMLKQEQSEVDFEKELDRIWFDNKFGDYFDNSAVDFARIRTLCKHFFEFGVHSKQNP